MYLSFHTLKTATPPSTDPGSVHANSRYSVNADSSYHILSYGYQPKNSNATFNRLQVVTMPILPIPMEHGYFSSAQ